MDGEGLLMFIYSFNIRLQELVAFVAQTYALNHTKVNAVIPKNLPTSSTANPSPEHDEDISNDPSVLESASEPTISGNAAFTKVLKSLPSKQLDDIQSLKKQPATQEKIYKPQSKEIRDDIDVSGLDSSFLFKLMLSTDFLDNRSYKGVCKKHNLDKCCNSCDHSTKTHNRICKKDHSKCDHKCYGKNCGLLFSRCGKVCCDVCKICIQCNDELYKGYKDVMMKKTTEKDVKEYSDCLIAIVKDNILSDGIKFRNLFHLTVDDCQKLIDGKNHDRCGGFTDLKTPDDLFKLMKICTCNLISLICNDEYFAEQCDQDKFDAFAERLNNLFTNKQHVIKDFSNILSKNFDLDAEERANVIAQLTALKLEVKELKQSTEENKHCIEKNKDAIEGLTSRVTKLEKERKEQEFYVKGVYRIAMFSLFVTVIN